MARSQAACSVNRGPGVDLADELGEREQPGLGNRAVQVALGVIAASR